MAAVALKRLLKLFPFAVRSFGSLRSVQGNRHASASQPDADPKKTRNRAHIAANGAFFVAGFRFERAVFSSE